MLKNAAFIVKNIVVYLFKIIENKYLINRLEENHQRYIKVDIN